MPQVLTQRKDAVARQRYCGEVATIEDLHARVRRGAYRALPSRRRYIPKADGSQRPLAVARPGSVVDPDEVVEFCRAGLAAFKRPRLVVQVDEPYLQCLPAGIVAHSRGMRRVLATDVDGCTLATRDGQLARVIHLAGFAFETAAFSTPIVSS